MKRSSRVLSTARASTLTALVAFDSAGWAAAMTTMTLFLALGASPWLVGFQLIAAMIPRAVIGRRLSRWIARAPRAAVVYAIAVAASTAGGVLLLFVVVFQWSVALLFLGIALVATARIVDGALVFELVGGLSGQEREQQVAALGSARNIAPIFGAPLAGLAWAALGPAPAMIGNVVTSAALLLVAVVAAVLFARRDAMVSRRSSSRSTLEHGRWPSSAKFMVIAFVAFGLVSSLQSPVAVVLITRDIGASPFWFGVVEGLWGVGALIAGIVASRLRRLDRATAFGLAIAVYGVAVATLGLWPSLPVAGLCYLLGALGLVLGNISFSNFLYDHVPETVRLHVRTESMIWNAGALASGFAIGGLLIEYARAITAASGLLSIVVAIAVLLWRWRVNSPLVRWRARSPSLE